MTLIAESPWADWLVLRGSMTMPAWVGDAARPPGDLDWIVRPPTMSRMDDLDPYPYFDRLAPVQEWPEAAHGAARNEMWEFEEFDTAGRHPRLPPEGLNWIPAAGLDSLNDEALDDELAELIRQDARTPGGIEFEPEAIGFSSDWDYAEYEPGGENGRVRFGLPWRAPDGEEGEVQIDVAFGEDLPDAPVCTAVPRSGGLPPVGLWTATRELSLAWKLHWLAADQRTHRVSAMKDLYDAVLLAELPDLHLRPRLRSLAVGTLSTEMRSSLSLERSSEYTPTAPSFSGPAPSFASPAPLPSLVSTRTLEQLLDPVEIRRWTVSGTPPGGGDSAPWLARLADAVTRLL
ncbi:nucleotidyl transferase AbiEii/AbiGii toxin family protein [Actinoplanes regularis]|uniref:nucleotidyl transferase AbiEii/AbiGii toxin family protein n=1 Tax=Actinoplanes regularis TaxID=52697 RepID=UPI0024A1A50B|nr:nucleotidyl transferase AbiEii/AbiGii toxin family protein [Actinoplanes regularis]GLW28238.1 hypothetical protein Areg01_11780 [Actinoplanes regularis]